MNANRQVFLVNPNGILFGQTAQVNVGGLVATTHNINDTLLNTTGVLDFTSNSLNAITNETSITLNAANSSVVLAATKVINNGSINNSGEISLLAGKKV